MVVIEVGRVCKKLQGREAGRFCVVIGLVDEGYVDITGPKDITDIRRRKCNILHLEPTPHVIEIKKDASDADVGAALKKADLIDLVSKK